MNDCIDRIVVEHTLQSTAVKDIHLVKLKSFSCDLPDFINSFRLGIAEVIHNDDLMSCAKQFNAGMAPNKTGAACYQYCHVFISFRNG